MKQLILSILFTCINLSLFAFDYQTFYSHRTVLYKNSNEKIIGFKIDSVKINTDSIFYPLKNAQFASENCINLNGASWMGDKIIVKPDWNYFFNEKNDTIKIKTNARLHESWVFYKNDNLLVDATVYFHDTMKIFGIVDSVKNIQLQAYYFKTPGIFSGAYLLLSKRFGLINTLNLNFFPEISENYILNNKLENYVLAGMDYPKLGLQNLTWFDVFDFQPGDEIHTHNIERNFIHAPIILGSEDVTQYIYRYLKRTNYNDSIVYETDRTINKYSNYKNVISGNLLKRDTIITTIRKNYTFDQLPGTTIVDNGFAMINSMSANEFISKSDYDQGIFFFKSSDNCWGYPIWDGCLFISKYIKGLGGPYGNCTGFVLESSKELVYFKKGLVTWGNPLLINRNDEISMESNISVFPNPTHKMITLKINHFDKVIFISLMNMQGIFILKQSIDNPDVSIDLSDLPGGIYFCKIYKDEKVLKTEKIIKY